MTHIKLTGTSPTKYTAQIVKDDTTLVITNATATIVPYVAPVVVPSPTPTLALAPTHPQPTGKAHVVVVAFKDIATDNAWSATATVGEDWKVAGQYIYLKNDAGTEHPGISAKIYSDCVDVGADREDNGFDFLSYALQVIYDGEVTRSCL